MGTTFQIKSLRESKHLSQQALAERIGYKSGSAITMWETGARNPPSKVLPQLAAVLDCSIDDLYTQERSVEQNSA